MPLIVMGSVTSLLVVVCLILLVEKHKSKSFVPQHSTKTESTLYRFNLRANFFLYSYNPKQKLNHLVSITVKTFYSDIT